MDLAVVARAVGMFAVTNVDDLVVLTVLLARAPGRAAAARVVGGQYLGFLGILAAAVAGALGAGVLPHPAVAYLGLLPLALGLRAAWSAWRERGAEDRRDPGAVRELGLLPVAAVTLANGGDNIGVYLPVFATSSRSGLVTYAVVFLVMVAVWCAAGRFLATRRPVAATLARWGHVVLPVVLVGIGVLVLVEGGAFGL